MKMKFSTDEVPTMPVSLHSAIAEVTLQPVHGWLPPETPASMTCFREHWRLASISPQRWAKSRTLAFRSARLFIVGCVLLGQIGLPDLAALCCRGGSAEVASPDAAAGCRCAPVLKRRSRCCCAAPKLPSPLKSCCAKRPDKQAEPAACQTAAAKNHSASLSYRDACGCGTGDEVPGYRCTDPRVMPPSLKLAGIGVPSFGTLLMNDESCGDALPPPSPPPRSLAV